MVAASGSHAMLITEQGRLYSWGLNCTGQLGACAGEFRDADGEDSVSLQESESESQN